MQNLYIYTLDLETLSYEAKDLITFFVSAGLSPTQIRKLVNLKFKRLYIPPELCKEIDNFLCDNWKTIQKIGF